MNIFLYILLFGIFERCLDSNPECYRNKQARYQISHTSPCQLSHHPSPSISHPSPYNAEYFQSLPVSEALNARCEHMYSCCHLASISPTFSPLERPAILLEVKKTIEYKIILMRRYSVCTVLTGTYTTSQIKSHNPWKIEMESIAEKEKVDGNGQWTCKLEKRSYKYLY